MTRWSKIGTTLGLSLALAAISAADTLEMKDGRVLHGRYLGGTQAVLRFEVDGDVRTFSTTDVVALTFTGRNDNAPPADNPPPPANPPAPATPPQAAAPQSAPAPSAPPPPAMPAQSSSSSDQVTLQPGQPLLVRMIDGVDSTKNRVGDVFKASLGHEQKVSAAICAIYEVAAAEKDYATLSFLKWFLDEQVEEERNVGDVLAKLELVGDNLSALYQIDQHAGRRAEEDKD